MPLTDLQIGLLVEKYERERDRHEKMASTVERELRASIGTSPRALVTARAKDPGSLKKKLEKYRDEYDFAALKDEFWPTVVDLAGARVMLYEYKQDHEEAHKRIAETFDVAKEKDHGTGKQKYEYQARHRVVKLRAGHLSGHLSNLKGVVCEIQVVSLAKHIWNELEHDITYKPGRAQPPAEMIDALNHLWTALDNAEEAVSLLSGATLRHQQQQLGDTQPIGSVEELGVALAGLVNRPIRGQLPLLWSILERTQHPVTKRSLSQQGFDQDARLAEAKAKAGQFGISDPDDAELWIFLLANRQPEDVLPIVHSWVGPRGRVQDALDRLAAQMMDEYADAIEAIADPPKDRE